MLCMEVTRAVLNSHQLYRYDELEVIYRRRQNMFTSFKKLSEENYLQVCDNDIIYVYHDRTINLSTNFAIGGSFRSSFIAATLVYLPNGKSTIWRLVKEITK